MSREPKAILKDVSNLNDFVGSVLLANDTAGIRGALYDLSALVEELAQSYAETLTGIGARFSVIEGRFGQVEDRLNKRIDNCLGIVGEKFGQLNRRIDSL